MKTTHYHRSIKSNYNEKLQQTATVYYEEKEGSLEGINYKD